MKKKWMVVILNVAVFLTMGFMKAEPGSPKPLKKKQGIVLVSSTSKKRSKKSLDQLCVSEEEDDKKKLEKWNLKTSAEKTASARVSLDYGNAHFRKLRCADDGKIKDSSFGNCFYELNASNELPRG